MSLKSVKNSYSQLRSDLKKVKGTLALIGSLRSYLRERVTVEQAREEIKKALQSREERFLELVHTRVYQVPNSPYLKLLKFAGCDFCDLESHVRRHGLERTLEQLAREGVYLTAAEFKGKQEVVRGGGCFRVTVNDFDRRDASPGLITQSSGTRNQPVRTSVALDWLALRTPLFAVFLDAHDLFTRAHAIYEPILPVTVGVHNVLHHAKFGITTDCWFACKIPSRTRFEAWYHEFMTSLVVLTGRMLGHRLPKPRFIDVSQIDQIIHWISEQRNKRKGCCIKATTSNAVRIARVALEMGVSLEGTRFVSTGEPLTEAKHEIINRAGASAIPRYSYGGGISVGLGCANRAFTDEVHVNEHLLAMIRSPRDISSDGLIVHPLLCTTLSPLAPRLLLNVDNGDYATLMKRDCGCGLERVGLTLHMHNIRSYEKFTGEGMNYFYGDLFELFENTLPSEFGGGPGDYQLVEEEDNGGQTRLTLVVHPDVQELNEERVLARLRAALANGSRGNRFMTGVWENAGTFRVKREIPHASPRGKILPLHIPQKKTTALDAKASLPRTPA
jgi:hypothetical protein